MFWNYLRYHRRSMNKLIKKAADLILSSKKTIALTGAGISVESGIPLFRGKGSLWEKIDPMEYAHINSFLKDPEKVWKGLLIEMGAIIGKAIPNDGHKGLAFLEKNRLLDTIITQNVDGLHQSAGNSDVIEFHGSFAWQRCLECHKQLETAKVDLSKIPPECECGGILRPDCIFFGEMIPEDYLWRSQKLSSECELMLVIGTSAVVQPASMMPEIAKKNGASVIEINPEETPLSDHITDCFLKGNAGSVMNQIISVLGV